MKYDHTYDDIIHHSRHISKKHPLMSLYARSAQFAPFAALTGYEETVKETARETNERINIDEEIKAILDNKIQIILENINQKKEIEITYFIPDISKKGGKYITVLGIIKKIDLYSKNIILLDNTLIPINEIINIS